MYPCSNLAFYLTLAQMYSIFTTEMQDCYKVENMAYDSWSERLQAENETTCWKTCQQTSWCFKASFDKNPITLYPTKPNIFDHHCYLYNRTATKKEDYQFTGFICKVLCNIIGKDYVSTGDKTIIDPACKMNCSCSLKENVTCVSLCPSVMVRCKETEQSITYQQSMPNTQCTCEKIKCEPQIPVSNTHPIIIGIAVPAAIIILLIVVVSIIYFKRSRKTKTEKAHIKAEQKESLKTDKEDTNEHYTALTGEERPPAYELLEDANHGPIKTANYEIDYSQIKNLNNKNNTYEYVVPKNHIAHDQKEGSGYEVCSKNKYEEKVKQKRVNYEKNSEVEDNYETLDYLTLS